MKDVKKLLGTYKQGEKKQLRRSVLQFLAEHKGKAYTKEELIDKMEMSDEMAALLDDTSLITSSSFWHWWFHAATIKSKSEGLETYYYYDFDWFDAVMPGFITSGVSFCVSMILVDCLTMVM